MSNADVINKAWQLRGRLTLGSYTGSYWMTLVFDYDYLCDQFMDWLNKHGAVEFERVDNWVVRFRAPPREN